MKKGNFIYITTIVKVKRLGLIRISLGENNEKCIFDTAIIQSDKLFSL